MSFFSLGEAYRAAGRHGEAADAYEKALEHNPAMSRALQHLGEAQLKLGPRGRGDRRRSRAATRSPPAAADVLPMRAMEERLKRLGAPIPEVKSAAEKAAELAAESGGAMVLDKRTGQPQPRLDGPPMRGPIGAYIAEHFGQVTWTQWIGQGTKVINELRLDFSNPGAPGRLRAAHARLARDHGGGRPRPRSLSGNDGERETIIPQEPRPQGRAAPGRFAHGAPWAPGGTSILIAAARPLPSRSGSRSNRACRSQQPRMRPARLPGASRFARKTFVEAAQPRGCGSCCVWVPRGCRGSASADRRLREAERPDGPRILYPPRPPARADPTPIPKPRHDLPTPAATRRPHIGGNWKMNLDLAGARSLASALKDGVADAAGGGVDVTVFPAMPHLAAVAEVLGGSPIAVGAQNAYFEPDGAFTGETSVLMLKDLGVSAVLVGHSRAPARARRGRRPREREGPRRARGRPRRHPRRRRATRAAGERPHERDQRRPDRAGPRRRLARAARPG